MSRPTVEVARREVDLRRLELIITRHLDGLMHGEHSALVHGPGTDAGDGRPYNPGDDARRIDWSLTARSNAVHIRDTIAERELETWLVVDASASLEFGTAVWTKRDLAITAAAAFGLLGRRGGNRTGALVFDGQRTDIVAPLAGRDAVLQLLRRLDRRPTAPPGAASLATAIHQARRAAHHRGRMVVISDLIDSGPWPAELRMAAAHHQVVVVEISDPREWELPAVGLLTLHDPETGSRCEVQTSNADLRRRFAEAAQRRRRENADAVRSAGALHLQLSTDRDWMRDLVAFAARHRGGVDR
ncbi:MAG: DUF58 domain-containing protein [Ilumatobacteraceae bacterium]